MFGSIKKAMVVGAIAATAALTPSVASADEWFADGVTVGGAPGVAALATGSLSFTTPLGGGATATTTCDVEATVDAYNLAGVAHGQVTSFGVPDPTSCSVTSLPAGIIGDCKVQSVTSTASVATPWTIDTTGTNLTITGVNFTNVYATDGPNPCLLATAPRNVTGNVTGSWSNAGSTLSFTNATGLVVDGSTPVQVNGSVEVAGEGGEVITLG